MAIEKNTKRKRSGSTRKGKPKKNQEQLELKKNNSGSSKKKILLEKGTSSSSISTIVACSTRKNNSGSSKRKVLLGKGTSNSSISTIVPCSTRKNNSDHYGQSTIPKTICFWGDSFDRDEMYWYVLNITLDRNRRRQQAKKRVREIAILDHEYLHRVDNNGPSQEEEVMLTPLLSCQKPSEDCLPVPLWDSSFACLASTVYSIGGNHTERRRFLAGFLDKGTDVQCSALVHYFDTSEDECCWKQAPSMITPRWKPQVVTLNNKFYVFGCSGIEKCGHKPSCSVWAEVYDPNEGLWTPLPSPPSLLLNASEFLVIRPPNHLRKKLKNEDKKILVVAGGTYACEFDIEANCWKPRTVDKFFEYWSWKKGNPPVQVGNMLYWFDNEVHAYDIDRGIRFSGPVQDSGHHIFLRSRYFEAGINADRPAILHLGGRYFCLLLFLPDPATGGPMSVDEPGRIHCSVIKVTQTKERYKDDDEFFLRVPLVSCQSFPMHLPRYYMDGLFMPI